MKKLILLSLVITLSPIFLFAHGDKKHHPTKLDTVTVFGNDTIAVNGIPVIDSRLSSDAAEEQKNKNHLEIEEKFKFNISNALFEHVHNKIIHFPISLALAAFLFSLFGIRDNRYDKTIKILLLIAGIFGIAAFLTGLNQFAAFEGEPKQWVAETHRLLGIASAVSIWLWYFILFIKPLYKLKWVIIIITVLLITATGFYGGVLAH
ncbi:MAG: hypothetical protein HRF52_07785 [Ignavibacterium sp.]|jgi:uncharacterized membrane protein|uniref:hypothetical protein n=1 Tax=Ignavibacterium sp. TaxID=2651167 RepID=UPI003297DC1B